MDLFSEKSKVTETILNKAFKFLSYRPRSEKEVIDYLRRKKFTETAISQTVEKLAKQNFINDEDFAKWWIEQRQNYKPKGKFAIKKELTEKGIKKEIVDKLFDSSYSEYETAKALFEKKKDKFAKLPKDEFFKKASAFLLRRGFGWETIKKVLDYSPGD